MSKWQSSYKIGKFRPTPNRTRPFFFFSFFYFYYHACRSWHVQPRPLPAVLFTGVNCCTDLRELHASFVL